MLALAAEKAPSAAITVWPRGMIRKLVESEVYLLQ